MFKIIELKKSRVFLQIQYKSFPFMAILDKETIELQTQYFGVNGEYFLKRQEFIQPIQDRVFNAMKKIAKREGYAFVFDKSNQSNLVYAEKEYDISNTVLEEMGISKE